jgi:hypothetical protein
VDKTFRKKRKQQVYDIEHLMYDIVRRKMSIAKGSGFEKFASVQPLTTYIICDFAANLFPEFN